MAKYLVQGSYTVDGLKGLQKEKATSRKAAVAKACEASGGRLESFYYSFGGDDVVAVFDMPDNVAAAALAVAVCAAGLVRIRTTPLLTIEEMDKALGTSTSYRAPGH